MAVFMHQLLNGEVVELRIRRHSATQHISMRFYGGAIRLTVPKYLPANAVKSFLKEHDLWIEKQFCNEKKQLNSAQLQLPSELNNAERFPYLGEMVPFKIKAGLVSRLDFSDGQMVFVGPMNLLQDSCWIGGKLRGMLQQNLLEIIKPLVEKWTSCLGVSYTGIQLSNAKKRWGCCTSQGRLRFNWRLIFTPQFVIESVVIHEACHLVEMNHGTAFKSLEQKCNPRVSEYDQWLREQGWTVLTFEFCRK